MELISRTSDVRLSEKESRFCFGMSKMTVRDEVGHHDEYYKLSLPEFYEFLGRVAHARYVDEKEMPLHLKLERVLDDLFRVFAWRRRDASLADGEPAWCIA